VLTLMLLWRHGNIVFHDSTDKPQQAVPWLMANTAQSGVVWEDCHIYPQQLSDETDQVEPDDQDADEPADEQPEDQTPDATQPSANQAEEPGKQGE
jgi:hypothetical protein